MGTQGNSAHKKELCYMRVAVHPIKAALWKNRSKIMPGMSLRQIGKLIGVNSAQQIQHHLETMVTMGAIDYIGGLYVFPAEILSGKKSL